MKVKIKEICEINPKMKLMDDNFIVSFVGMAQISNDNQFDVSILKKYKDVKNGFSSFKNGDIIFAKITPCMENGKGVLIENLYNGIGFGSTEFHILRPNIKMVDKKYLYWLTMFKKFRLNCEKNMTGSAGQKRVPKNYIENYEFSLPTLDIQQKRAKILDYILKIKQEKFQQLKELENLSKCLFFSMFGDPSFNERDFIKEKLKNNIIEMFLGPFGSSLKVESYTKEKKNSYMVYEQKHAIKKTLNLENNYITREKYEELKRFEVKPLDFIMSCRGTIGEIYQIPIEAPAGIIHPSLMKIRVDTRKYNYKFFETLLTFYISRETTTGSGIKMAITAKELGEKKFIMPPLQLQEKFAEKIKLIEKSKFTISETIKLMTG